jgi:hypothetical protein
VLKKRLLALVITAILLFVLAFPVNVLAETRTVRLQAHSQVEGRHYPHGPEGSMGLNGLKNRTSPELGATIRNGKTAWIFSNAWNNANNPNAQRLLIYFNLNG